MDGWPHNIVFPPSFTRRDTRVSNIHELNNLVLPPIRTLGQRNEDSGLRNHLETLRDVESAFQNADLALRNAREALRNGRIMSGRSELPNMSNSIHNGNDRRRPASNSDSNVVDLTSLPSDTSNEDFDFLPPPYGRARMNDFENRSIRIQTRHSAVRSQPPIDGEASFLPVHWSSLGFGPRPPINNHRADESAVRRQRQARRSWERVERRNRERAAEQARRDAVERARTFGDHPIEDTSNTTNATRARRSSSSSTVTSLSNDSEYSLDSGETRPTTNANTQETVATGTSTMTANDPIDLTSNEGQSAIENVLSMQQQAAIESQKPSTTLQNSASIPHATPLSTYRCAICMDTPTTATTTVCGHLFCHTCLKDSLKWSAQQRRDDAGLHGRRAPNAGQGLCPVCRKVLNDKDGGPKQGIVGLEIRTISRKNWERRKKQDRENEEREKFLRELVASNAEKEKGKEREVEQSDDVTSKVKTEGQPTDLDFGLGMGGRTRKRRRDEYGEFENSEGF